MKMCKLRGEWCEWKRALDKTGHKKSRDKRGYILMIDLIYLMITLISSTCPFIVIDCYCLWLFALSMLLGQLDV